VRSLVGLADFPLDIVIAGRNRARGEKIVTELARNGSAHTQTSFTFEPVDIDDEFALSRSISKCDLVIHAAGPFQRRSRVGEVLKAAIRASVNYMDVCDDLTHAKECKTLDQAASDAGVSAWISTGIYPGLSNLLAAELVSQKPESRPVGIKFSYYTAGTGGIGPTVLASTFLILSEDVITFNHRGEIELRPPASGLETVDFGGRIGQKHVYLLNLPEVSSIHDLLLRPTGGGEVLAKLSTDPPMWNWLLRATARVVPRSALQNRTAMQALSVLSLPVVRLVDRFSGARTGIRVDAQFCQCPSETTPSTQSEHLTYSKAVYEHETLSGCVGDSTAAFALELLLGTDPVPGVRYPEEISAAVRKSILANASRGADRLEI
jgi:hypothetical protein